MNKSQPLYCRDDSAPAGAWEAVVRTENGLLSPPELMHRLSNGTLGIFSREDVLNGRKPCVGRGCPFADQGPYCIQGPGFHSLEDKNSN